MNAIVSSNYLFVYGTLLDVENKFGSYLKNNCSYYADGKFKGLLYDIGEYPGAVLADGDTYVYGRIYMMLDIDAILERLDDYEGFGSEQEQPNLFVREVVEVTSDKGLIYCWCYLYNLNVDALRLIIPGDYLAYRKKL